MSALDILEKTSNNGIIQTKIALENGISRATLSKLCKAGKLVRIANGQYILSDDVQDEMLSLQLRSKSIIFSHESALYLNGISERTPFVHTVTIPSEKTLSRSISKECKIYYIKNELYELGKIQLPTTMGNLVWAYDMDRTICDIIRSHSRVADETFISSLKLYAKSPKKNFHNLSLYAKKLGVLLKVIHYMEILC